ncbi:MAG: ATP-binding protein [Bacteroidota bacterium]
MPDSATATGRPSFKVREWTLDDGLSTPVLSVAQTPDGLLWITTFDGLVRFDGVRFHAYTTDNTPVFRSHDFVGVYASTSGDVWTGGRDGWAYRLRDGEWSAWDVSDILKAGAGQGKRLHWVQGFAEDADGTLWLASTGSAVARFDGERWTAIDQRIRDVWTPFLADREGTLWTYLDASEAPDQPQSFIGGVVARWDGARFVPAEGARLDGFVPSRHGPLFLRERPPDAEGAFGADVVNAQGDVLGWYPLDEGLAIPQLVDRAGRVWVRGNEEATQGTLVVYDDGVEVLRVEPEGATNIEQVFEDRQGSVWIHARSTGLFQVTEEPFRRFGPSEGAPRYSVRASAGSENEILVSPESDVDQSAIGVTRGDSIVAEAIRPAPGLDLSRLSNGRLQIGQVVAHAGTRWGVTNRFLFRITNSIADIAWSADSPSSFWTLDPDTQDSDLLWIGDSDGRALAFDTARGVVIDTLQVEGRVFFAQRAADGRLWIGSEGGLAVADGSGLQVLSDSTLAGQGVRMMYEAPDGTLWLATGRNGLVRYRESEARSFGVAEGLPSEHVTAVTVDPLGIAWLGGRDVLHRVPLADVEAVLDGDRARADVVTLLSSDGPFGTSRKASDVAWAPDGSLWIPSFKGVTRIDPVHYARLHAAPLTPLVDVIRTEGGQSYAPADGLRLPAGERTLDIEYTAADFLAPRLVRFRTYLEGHDAGWVDRGSERRATVGGLAPGTYTFWVQAMNGGGVWSEPVAAPAFVVPPRMWETWWFAGLALGTLAALVVGVVRARTRVLTDRQRELNRVVTERTEELRVEKETVAAQAEALRSLDATKTRLFANVSHEFRTPLTLTIGPLDDVLAGEHGEVPVPIGRQLAVVRRNAGRVLDLVEQILDVARLEAGRVTLQSHAVGVAAFVAPIVEAFRPLADRKAIALTVDVASGATIEADPAQLEKALSNLLSNALKFSPDGGAVRVTVENEDTSVRIAVRDSGPGIPAADLPHVFDRFYQAEGASELVEPGTGIGLALASEVVKLHGGTLVVESVEGFGSTFVMSLPVLPDASPAPLPDREPSRPEALTAGPPVSDDAAEDRTTVLVVEDNAEVRAYVRRHLAPAYRVIEADDGEAGLAAAREHLPDLVLSDVMMPGMDGTALCRALKADPDTDFIPVVLLTARAAREDRIGGLEGGADDYLTKPFDVRELRVRVDNLIATRRRLRERLAGGDGALPTTWTPASADVTSANDAFLMRVRETIEAEMADDTLTVGRLAEAVGVSRSQLHRQLRALADTTPSDLIWTARLDRAAQLLDAEAGTVSEVAYAVGFKSVSHFSDRFDERFGCRPSGYGAAPDRE